MFSRIWRPILKKAQFVTTLNTLIPRALAEIQGCLENKGAKFTNNDISKILKALINNNNLNEYHGIGIAELGRSYSIQELSKIVLRFPTYIYSEVSMINIPAFYNYTFTLEDLQKSGLLKEHVFKAIDTANDKALSLK